MLLENTLSIIKPEAVKNKISGKIISMIEENNFIIIAQKKLFFSKKGAELFYKVHEKRPFFNSLIQFMILGPSIVQVLRKENAILDYRKLMGATNPKEALNGTIRYLYGTDIEKNAVHGSDSKENAQDEINFFFSQYELNSLF